MSESGGLAILGAGNIGRAMAVGLAAAGSFPPSSITLTARRGERLTDLAQQGFNTTSDNAAAVAASQVVIAAVGPQDLDALMDQIRDALRPEQHLLISVVSGASLDDLARLTHPDLPIARAMPNTGIAVGRSMTTVATRGERDTTRAQVESIFNSVGRTLMVNEEMMSAATALGACGVAFFLRAVRAAAQGGIEIGFHPEEALTMAAQTALGAASLVLERSGHPEAEIDHVTTPRGCTIAGLNEMEHQGFSSAMIKGITTSAAKADSLYSSAERDKDDD